MSVLNLFIKLFYITIFYYYIKYKYSIYTTKNNLTIILFLFCPLKKQTLNSTKAHICEHKCNHKGSKKELKDHDPRFKTN